jgi:hypothetical protein
LPETTTQAAQTDRQRKPVNGVIVPEAGADRLKGVSEGSQPLRRQFALNNYFKPILAFAKTDWQTIDRGRILVIFFPLFRGAAFLVEPI